MSNIVALVVIRVALDRDDQQLRRWERKIAFGYRMFIGLYALAGASTLPVAWLIARASFVSYVQSHLLYPLVLLAVVEGCVEWGLSRLRRGRHTLLIVTGVLLASIAIYFNPRLHAIESILLLPILASVFFLSPKKVWLAGILAMLAECILYWLNPFHGHESGTTPYDLITFIVELVGETVVCHGIIARGAEIWEELRKRGRLETELLVRQIVSEKDAKTDALTGLYNRKSFNEYLEFALRISAETDTPLHLAVIDIDNFKQVNDRHGHLVGDDILRRTARAIEYHLAAGDFLARYGGEEFALIIPEMSHEEAVAHVEKIREKIANIHHAELTTQHATVSIGLCTYVPGEDSQALFQRADQCLYQAKKSGKNRTIAHP
ncbi:diguanylate cyclase (GGDEF) domain-containing protein [Alicyclobacillus hesperidum]|uniref:Diguanylate cyclase (GGDEF) domain-containing protein n=1 Tax=Alicyclobacillus hesperidum TaxID=89784 RepID=A0A1H2VXJ4_9BACL|nr:diguanylate cyclase (GGDEF) domain-containing protein [Alicyclobacillus hesperidum]